MNNSSIKTIIPILLGTLLSGACSNDEQIGREVVQQTYSVVLKSITMSGEESSEELKVYLFSSS